MGTWTIFLLVVAVFVAIVYFFEESISESYGRAALRTGGFLLSLALLTVIGGALWALV